MPHFQAVVRALAGRNRQKSPIAQVEWKTNALMPHNFFLLMPRLQAVVRVCVLAIATI